MPVRTRRPRWTTRILITIDEDEVDGASRSGSAFRVPATGTLFDGKYRAIRRIGEGGMGSVILARDEHLQRNVAVKFIRSDLVSSESVRRDFLAEARTMARVRHANLVEIYAFGEHDDIPFFVMEYVPGRDLHDWLMLHEDGVLTIDEAIGILSQVCRGVEAMHAQGTIHHDLKPGNILIGPQFRVAITDFGLARFIQKHAPDAASVPIGTPPFTAPEITRGGPLDPGLAPRVDVYALGVIAYQLLTGCYMFPIDDTQRLFHYQHSYDPMAPSAVRHELPPAFDGPILSALHRDPASRTPTPDAFWQALLAARDVTQTRAVIPPYIVVADDDPACRKWADAVLRDAVLGAEVLTVSDGRQALAAARRRRPSLVIADLQMPELNGIELTAMLRGDPATHDVPIMIVTAVGGAPEWSMLNKLGASEFMVKPLLQDPFAAAARRLLKTRRL